MEKDVAIKIIDILKQTYPDAKCSLDFSTPFEMLVAVILSAQCTDERVNKTTPSIFCKYSTPEDFNNMPLETLEELIHPCGFYKNKAKNIIACSKRLVEVYNSKVPDNIEDLMTLAGVGRKSANVIMLEAFNKPVGIAVDTHAKRVSSLVGFSKESDPEKIEQDLLKQFPEKYLKDINHLFVWHGRNTCIARRPKCDICPINKYCDEYNKNKCTK